MIAVGPVQKQRKSQNLPPVGAKLGRPNNLENNQDRSSPAFPDASYECICCNCVVKGLARLAKTKVGDRP